MIAVPFHYLKIIIIIILTLNLRKQEIKHFKKMRKPEVARNTEQILNIFFLQYVIFFT